MPQTVARAKLVWLSWKTRSTVAPFWPFSATANPTAREGFFTLDDDFVRVPFGDIDAIKQALNDYSDICAVMLEPIQGESGVNTAANGFEFLNQVRQVCDDNQLLMILDEVQTGNGRTGKYFFCLPI